MFAVERTTNTDRELKENTERVAKAVVRNDLTTSYDRSAYFGPSLLQCYLQVYF